MTALRNLYWHKCTVYPLWEKGGLSLLLGYDSIPDGSLSQLYQNPLTPSQDSQKWKKAITGTVCVGTLTCNGLTKITIYLNGNTVEED